MSLTELSCTRRKWITVAVMVVVSVTRAVLCMRHCFECKRCDFYKIKLALPNVDHPAQSLPAFLLKINVGCDCPLAMAEARNRKHSCMKPTHLRLEAAKLSEKKLKGERVC